MSSTRIPGTPFKYEYWFDRIHGDQIEHVPIGSDEEPAKFILTARPGMQLQTIFQLIDGSYREISNIAPAKKKIFSDEAK